MDSSIEKELEKFHSEEKDKGYPLGEGYSQSDGERPEKRPKLYKIFFSSNFSIRALIEESDVIEFETQMDYSMSCKDFDKAQRCIRERVMPLLVFLSYANKHGEDRSNDAIEKMLSEEGFEVLCRMAKYPAVEAIYRETISIGGEVTWNAFVMSGNNAYHQYTITSRIDALSLPMEIIHWRAKCIDRSLNRRPTGDQSLERLKGERSSSNDPEQPKEQGVSRWFRRVCSAIGVGAAIGVIIIIPSILGYKINFGRTEGR